MSTWDNLTADGRVIGVPAHLHGVCLIVSAGGGSAVLYEGQDATSGKKIMTFEGANNTTTQVAFNPPLRCERGIYVDVGTNLTEILVHWSPIKDPWDKSE